MADDIQIFKGGLPSFITDGGLDEATKAIMGEGGARRISIRGGVFRQIVGGEETAKSEDRTQEWMVVNAAPSIHRTWFAGAYQEGQTVAPSCWSSNNKTPDAAVPNPPSSSCQDCRNNIKGSGQGESKACRFSRRLAVLPVGDTTNKVYQVVLPSTSIFDKGEHNKWGFDAYVRFLGNNGVGVTHVVTEAKFDTDSPTPKLVFKPIRPVTEDEYTNIVMHSKSQETARAIELYVSTPKEESNVVEFKKPDSEPKKRSSKKDKKDPPKSATDVVADWEDDDE